MPADEVVPLGSWRTWAQRLSCQTVAEVFHNSWDTVYRSVRYAVLCGVVHSQLSDVVAMGVDEIQWKRGHHYLTLVYQIDALVRRLLWVGWGGSEMTLKSSSAHWARRSCRRSGMCVPTCGSPT